MNENYVLPQSVIGIPAASALNTNILNSGNGTIATDTLLYKSLDFQINGSAGISAGVISFEGSDDGANFQPIYFYQNSTGKSVSTYTPTASSFDRFYGNVWPRWVRARISTAIVGGTVQAFSSMYAEDLDPADPHALLNTSIGDGTNTVAIKAASTAPTGGETSLVTTLSPNTTIPTSTSLLSAATTNAALIKASAGRLFFVFAENYTASTKFLRFYNKASAPTVGTDTPYITISIPANSSKEVAFYPSVVPYFSIGMAYAITGGSTDLDATATAAGDVRVLIGTV